MKILGQKNETTTKSNYQNASLAAKLNYLETEIDNLKTKVEISGGVPRCVESDYLVSSETKTFTGPGELYVYRYFDHHRNLVVDGIPVDGVAADWGVYVVATGNWYAYRIPFHDQCTIGYAQDDSQGVLYYSYHKY